jgi:hypothetical protein
MLPRRFWKSVIAIHKPVPKRLVLYWLVLLAPMLLTSAAQLMFSIWPDAAARHQDLLLQRQQTIRFLSMQPIPSTMQFALGSIEPKALLMVGILLWPWLTVLSLLVFRASMLQARIKTGHVLRCVIYSNDPLLLLAPLLVLTISVVPRAGSVVLPTMIPTAQVIIAAIILAVLTFRLGQAYYLYLRFPHVVATVIASQLMVGLALARVYFLWWGF